MPNLKIVEQQTEAELQAKRDQQKNDKERNEREESWRLTRSQIAARVRGIRAELESIRAQLEGMPFNVATDDTSPAASWPIDLTEMLNPCVKGRLDWLYERISEKDELFNLISETAETAYQIGVLAGPMFSGASDREIDRLERGLIHAIVSRSWRCKDRG